MFFVNTDCLSRKEAEILKVQIEQQAKERRMLELDYKARLKDDMVDILSEIQSEIEEQFDDRPFSYNHHQRTEFYRDVNQIIQDKINELKGE